PSPLGGGQGVHRGSVSPSLAHLSRHGARSSHPSGRWWATARAVDSTGTTCYDDRLIPARPTSGPGPIQVGSGPADLGEVTDRAASRRGGEGGVGLERLRHLPI